MNAASVIPSRELDVPRPVARRAAVRPQETRAQPRTASLRGYQTEALERADALSAPPQPAAPARPVRFRPIVLQELGPDRRPRRVDPQRFPGLPFDPQGRLDLNQLTPEHVRNLSPEQRKDFFRVLAQQSSLGNRGVAQSELPGDPRLDVSVALHLNNQDPSGRMAADIFAASPETIEILQRGLGRERGNELVQKLYGNLDTVARANPDNRLNEEQLKRLANITRETIKANKNNPQALQALTEQADASLARLRETHPEAADFNTGALLGATLKGVRDSGENPWEILAILGGIVGGKIGHTAGHLIGHGLVSLLRGVVEGHHDDPTGHFGAAERYLQGLSGPGAENILKGFVHSAFRLGLISSAHH